MCVLHHRGGVVRMGQKLGQEQGEEDPIALARRIAMAKTLHPPVYVRVILSNLVQAKYKFSQNSAISCHGPPDNVGIIVVRGTSKSCLSRLLNQTKPHTHAHP